jgi:predicted LPLAT superfamily acyltransferase
MDTAQHSSTRCPVFLHPAAASNPSTVRRIERDTGLTAHVTLRAARLKRHTLPAFEDFGPFGGAA